MKGIVLGGAASGVGKTVATLGLIRALEHAGVSVQPAKAGPDFIDPSHHEVVAGRPSRTLDVWLEGEMGLRRNYYRGSGDVCVVEGVMGLYDGACSSTARIAEVLDLPVVLVVDASAGMESVGATALGFKNYADQAGRDIDVVGIIAQRAHAGRHERGIREALPDDIEFFGRIPPRSGLEIPDRHLGLHMGDEAAVDTGVLDEIAEYLATERILETMRSPPKPEASDSRKQTEKRVAVARDTAFRFLYPAVIECLDERADVAVFSPVAGDDLPVCDGVYLPGGYPELNADVLSASPTLEALANRAAEGLPILGECGGLMALANELTTVDGERYPMAGVLPVEIRMHERYQALDHTEIEARSDTLTARRGRKHRGHEFHYSSANVDTDARFAFEVTRGTGIDGEHDGLTEYATLGTYCHLHAESGAFDAFIENL